MSEMQGIEPTLVIEDEIQDLGQMSKLLDNVRKVNRSALKKAKKEVRSSSKVNDKSKNRAKAKKAKSSRKANRG